MHVVSIQQATQCPTTGTLKKESRNEGFVGVSMFLLSVASCCSAQKTYKHSSEYELEILDSTARVYTGADATLASTTTDAKLSAGGLSWAAVGNLLHPERLTIPP